MSCNNEVSIPPFPVQIYTQKMTDSNNCISVLSSSSSTCRFPFLRGTLDWKVYKSIKPTPHDVFMLIYHFLMLNVINIMHLSFFMVNFSFLWKFITVLMISCMISCILCVFLIINRRKQQLMLMFRVIFI